jgi:hypothetical protein
MASGEEEAERAAAGEPLSGPPYPSGEGGGLHPAFVDTTCSRRQLPTDTGLMHRAGEQLIVWHTNIRFS